jgi:argininosuccinate synthase
MDSEKLNKVVLAYSGGLDTSIIVPWLKEHFGCEVVAYVGDVGQGDDELDGLEERAKATGASKIIIDDLKDEFCTDYLFPMIRTGAKYEGRYLLGTSIARPLIAKRMMDTVEKEGADAVSHGCTGKGNDQVRFELAFKAFNPKIRIIAPWRIWDIKSRDDAYAYAESHNVPLKVKKKGVYSHDRNLWHLSSEGGELEDPWQGAPEDLEAMTRWPWDAPDEGLELTIGFEKGVPKTIDGEALGPSQLVLKLNELGAAHGVGRVDIVENRLVGMKSRGVYDTPGGAILYAAHHELETLVLDGETLHFKEQLAPKYAELVYNGRYFVPLREALDAFVSETQQNVTGDVRLMLYKGNILVRGRRSPYSLYREDFATFGRDDVYHQADAEGFINLFGLPIKVRALIEDEMATVDAGTGYHAPKFSKFRDKFKRD